MTILIYYGKHGNEYYLADTPTQLEAAQQLLFKQLDEWHCYDDEDADHLLRARSGEIRAIRGILESRCCCEYEGWELEEVIDPCTS